MLGHDRSEPADVRFEHDPLTGGVPVVDVQVELDRSALERLQPMVELRPMVDQLDELVASQVAVHSQ
jgi:hypothetical protein